MRSQTISRIKLAWWISLVCYALALLVLCAGCRSRRSVTSSTVSHSETVTTKVPRDTLLPVPREVVQQMLPLPVTVPDMPPVTVRKGRAVSTVSVVRNAVQADCMCDTASIAARLWDTWTRTVQDTTTTQREVVVKYRTPQWAWWLLITAIIYISLRLLITNLKPL